jgi:hypothetical protein
MGSHQERLKVHRRSLRLDGDLYTVLSLRPSEAARFATTGSEGTRRILTEADGVQLLARLCWAMAFQRHARTMTVIDPTFLVPDPLGAGPVAPIVIINLDLGPLGPGAAAALRLQLPFAMPSAGTVALQTRGLDVALADPVAFGQRDDQAGPVGHHWQQWVGDSADLVVMAAPSPVLRAWGVSWSGLGPEGTDDVVRVVKDLTTSGSE